MSPGRRRGSEAGSPSGSGPGGRITPADLQAKLGEIRGDVDETIEGAKPIATYVAVGLAVTVIVVAFVLGRSRGRRKSTIVEIRRR
jgi:hypothetical protein